MNVYDFENVMSWISPDKKIYRRPEAQIVKWESTKVAI